MSRAEQWNTLAVVKRTQVRMLQDRGIDLPASETSWLGYSRARALERISAAGAPAAVSALLSIYLPDVWVYYCVRDEDTPAFGIENYEDMLAALPQGEKAKTLVLITHTRPTPKVWDALRDSGLQQLQHFLYKQLVSSVHDTVFACKYTALTRDEARKIYTLYMSDPRGFPAMSERDAVARWYGCRAGQLVRVHRPNLIQGADVVDISYRRVSAADPLTGKERGAGASDKGYP